MIILTNNQGSGIKNKIPFHTYWVGKIRKSDAIRNCHVLLFGAQIGRKSLQDSLNCTVKMLILNHPAIPFLGNIH